MDSLEDKLLKLKELLEKGMNNAGLGGIGSVKAGAILPSIAKPKLPGSTNSKTPSIGSAPKSKKNPIKQAEQTQNKDIKDIKMKEAQEAMRAQKPELVKFDENGQWSIEKSNYIGYTPEDNARRKANNLSEDTGIKTMNRIKQYGGSGANAAAKEAAEMRRRSKANPVKEFTPEQIAEINAQRNSKKD